MQTNSDMPMLLPLDNADLPFPLANSGIRPMPFPLVKQISYPYIFVLSLALAGVMDSLDHLRTPTTSLGKCNRFSHDYHAQYINGESFTRIIGLQSVFGRIFKTILKSLIYQGFTKYALPENTLKHGQILGKTEGYKTKKPSLLLIS